MPRWHTPNPCYRRPGAGLSPGRTAAIRNLIEAHVARTGTEPSDAELAAMCAISIDRVRRHRAKLEGRRP